MQVLITRPREDANRLLAEMTERGVEALVEPLMTIVPRRGVVLDLVGVQALLLTSANGARALAETTDRRDLRVLAVGEATATVARDAGFAQVESAEGNAEDLARMAMVRLEPKDGSLLHVAGRDVSGDLAGRLAQAGFAVRRVPLYEAEAATSLSPEAHVALGSGAIDAVLLFSPRTAATLVGLVRGEGLVERMSIIAVICLSPAVASAVQPIAWRTVVTALEPTQAELLAAFDRWRRGDTEPAKPTPPEIAGPEIGGPETAAKGVEMADMHMRDEVPGRPGDNKAGDNKAGNNNDASRPSQPTIDVEPIPETLRTGVTGRDGRGWRVAVTVILLALFLGIVVVALRPWWPRQIEAWLTANSATAPSATSATPPASSMPVAQPAPSAELAALRAELAKAQERAGEAERRAAALETRLGTIDGELAALKSSRAPAPASGETRDDATAALNARLAALESELKSLEQAARGTKPENDGELARRIDALAAAINARPAADPAELAALRAAAAQSNASQAQLVQRLAALEARQSNAQAHAERGASLALAVARLGQAARGSQPFDAELEALATQVGSDTALVNAIAPLRPLAETGIATLDQLRRRFPQVVSAVKQAELRGSHGGFIGEALARLARLVTVRRIEESEGAGADAALARAETALGDGNLAGAVAAIAALPAEQKASAASWLDAAEARLTVERVMAQLSAVAGAPRS